MDDLNKNEKNVLKLLVDNGRVLDKEVASKLKISAQAVGKIRKRLENSGIIKGYCANVDFKKLGIESFAMLFFEVLPSFWEKYSGQITKKNSFFELLKEMPQMIFSVNLLSSNYNFFSLEGFRNQNEMENHINLIRIKNRDFYKISKIETFSVDSILKFDQRDLVKQIIDNESVKSLSV